ncbi:sigma 54-interacting transcriptional regulator [Cetobacterium sp. 8H]|uniref:sigma-54 interaction domain-containing protein n=1 Tax=Cetobacterium sp. 8H TaxID=2759681 RepID=UPI00163CE8BE|nr:sigma 54-interacting transcriptional regulator [Cetobacterium sp. 8H]MBC2849898.1 sigma 54-interacting transcriptional regulator [Cetobacterium sp. 8H]
MNFLHKINKKIQKSAEMISEIIEIDVEIMDSELNRIAGTGVLKTKIGINMADESHIYKKILFDGKSRVIFNPRENDECSDCSQLKFCNEKFEVSVPIIVKKKIVGVIGLICFTENQKIHFIKNQESFITFLKQFSVYISNKVLDYLEEVNNENLVNFYSIQHKTENFLFISPPMKVIYNRILKISKTLSNVLLTGETGTGKEIIAKAIHLNSDYSNNSFVSINCGAIPENLFESELFGYIKGAFTGANPNGRIGKIQQAHNGTLFLDEIADMPLNMQVKLLRVLQEKKITPIGSNFEIDINVRIIAATNKNLEKMVFEGKFREDLFYRLNVVPLEIPPLRIRKDDIEILSQYFIKKYCDLFKKKSGISKDALEILSKYNWPGNVRELENAIEFALNVVGEDEIIRIENLPEKITKFNHSVSSLDLSKKNFVYLEEYYNLSTKEKKEIAKKFGISLATFYRMIQKEKHIK